MLNIAAAADRTFSFDPAHTALLIVDMQHDFLSPNGACGAAGANVAPLLEIVPRLQQLLASARQAGLAVFHTRYGFKSDLSNLPTSVRDQSREAGGEYGTPGPMGRILVEGEAGFEIVPELQPRPGEAIINKASFGAFTNTDLDQRLRDRGVTHLIIGGVTTQCCVEGTLREAVDRGYYCCTLLDGSAAFEQTSHDGTMHAIQSEGHLFGWIARCDTIVTALDRLQ